MYVKIYVRESFDSTSSRIILNATYTLVAK